MRYCLRHAMRVCGRHKVEEMLAWCAANPDQKELHSYALLFLFSYSFLLRGPSEALPAVVADLAPNSCSCLNCEATNKCAMHGSRRWQDTGVH